MLETLAMMPVRTMIEIVGAIILAAALLYAAVQWSRRRAARLDAEPEAVARTPVRQGAREKHGLAAEGHAAGSTGAADMPNPTIAGKLRSGRQGDRPTEDDILRQHMGPRGVPGEPSQANALTESETQIPKALDPGHTA